MLKNKQTLKLFKCWLISC